MDSRSIVNKEVFPDVPLDPETARRNTVNNAADIVANFYLGYSGAEAVTPTSAVSPEYHDPQVTYETLARDAFERISNGKAT